MFMADTRKSNGTPITEEKKKVKMKVSIRKTFYW